MGNTIGGSIVAYPAGADLSGSAGLGAVVNAAGNAVLAGAGVNILGVIQDTTPAADASGKMVDISVDGLASVITGAAVTAGDTLEVDAAAKFITLAAGKSVAVALQSAAGANATIRVKLL